MVVRGALCCAGVLFGYSCSCAHRSLRLLAGHDPLSDACMTTLSARADGRRSKSTNGRNRESRRDYGAAGSTRV